MRKKRLVEKIGWSTWTKDSLYIHVDVMEWLESPGKGRNTSVLLQEFERRFTQLLALDQIVLDMSKVLLFIKSVDPLH